MCTQQGDGFINSAYKSLVLPAEEYPGILLQVVAANQELGNLLDCRFLADK